MAEHLPKLLAGVYRHYKGPLYQVFGYAHDANADTLAEWNVAPVTPLGERAVVVYIGLELTAAHTGPRRVVQRFTYLGASWGKGDRGQ